MSEIKSTINFTIYILLTAYKMPAIENRHVMDSEKIVTIYNDKKVSHLSIKFVISDSLS